MRVTLKEVAEKAQVSVSTSSRALSGHPAISAETITKVHAAAEELNYERPKSKGDNSGKGSGLAGQNIGLISVGLDRSLVSMPVITNSFQGALDELQDSEAIVRPSDIPDLAVFPRDLRLDSLDAAILTGPMVEWFEKESRSPVLDVLREIPTVWILGRPQGAWGDMVGANDFRIGASAAEHFVKNGHKQLAFLNPMPENELFRSREDGLVSTARRLGAEVQSFCQAPEEGWSLPLKSPMAFETVQRLVDELLNASPRPTAVLAAADSVAALMYCAFGIRGTRVGEDISLIGGNNTPELLTVPYPHLTTYDIRANEIGKLAVRRLASKMSQADDDEIAGADVYVEPLFVPGQSVKDIS